VFGFFKKKFDVQKDMTISVLHDGKPIERDTDVPQGARVRLVTNGLSTRKLPELELAELPLELARSGAGLLNLVAGYCANEKPIKHGESWGSAMGGCFVAVRGFITTTDGREFLRLVDVDQKSADGQPHLAISTLAFLRGMSVVEEDRDAALVSWLAAVSYFPGVPTSAPTRAQNGALVNDQNFLNWVALARHDEEQHQAAHYRSALQRSPDLWRAEFGVTELPVLDAAAVKDAARTMITSLQDGELCQPWGPERMRFEGLSGADLMTMAPAPILEPTPEGLMQSVSVMPFPFRAYFFEAPVREVIASESSLSLLAELYAAALAKPEEVLALTLDTRNVYLPAIGPEWLLGSEDAAPRRAMSLSGPSLPVLSRLVADLGRRFAAELSVDEVRAIFGLRDDAALRESAERKMSALKDREGRLMGLSMGLDLDALPEA
jgi:hypothetical protein